MSIKKNEDNFDIIINSLKPIKYKFLNQSHQLDKIFKKLNIESIEKNCTQKESLQKHLKIRYYIKI